jgi:hypothetical protein
MKRALAQLSKLSAVCPLLSALLLYPAVASAQISGPQPLEGPNDRVEFFPRYDFQLEANLLTGDNPDLFRWDTHFGGEMDVFNYIKGRITVVTDYEAVLGSELRPFDPNQGNYTLEPAASWFVGKHEIAFVFHHVSRHFSDRPKRYAIAFNVIEGRYLRKFQFNGTSVAVRAGAGKIAQHSDVDYTWTADWDVTIVHPMNPYVQWYARTTGEMFGVDPTVRARFDVQHTTRLELGPRLIGKKADLELFLGVERRLDATPIDYLRPVVTWGVVGFRIASK